MEASTARLAQFASERRRTLGLTQADIASRGGPSTTTTSKIEAGAMASIPAQTRRKLEIGLGWKQGSVLQILEGGNPVLLDDPMDYITLTTEEAFLRPALHALILETEEAQTRFETAVAAMIAAEAEVDVLTTKLFRALVAAEFESEGGGDEQAAARRVTATDVAEAIVENAASTEQEWTRYEMALIERFAPTFLDGADLSQYSRYMDMTAVRKRASRIPMRETLSSDEAPRGIDMQRAADDRAAVRQLRRDIEGHEPPKDAAAHATGRESEKQRMMREQDEGAQRQD